MYLSKYLNIVSFLYRYKFIQLPQMRDKISKSGQTSADIESCTEKEHTRFASSDDTRREDSDRHVSRRRVLQTGSGLLAFGGLSGTASAVSDSSGKWNALEDFPKVKQQYNRHIARGERSRARTLLDKYDIGYGYTITAPAYSSGSTLGTADSSDNSDSTVISETVESGGPYSQGDDQFGTNDVWGKDKSTVGVGAVKIGNKTLDDGRTLPKFKATAYITLRGGKWVDLDSRGPADTSAISYEDTHWLARDISWSRPPGSIGEGGEPVGSEIKSGHIRGRYNEPKPPAVTDGQFQQYMNGTLLMHPNAQGVSQLYGHYGHVWNVGIGGIRNISINAGVLSITTDHGADKWELDTDPLLVED